MELNIFKLKGEEDNDGDIINEVPVHQLGYSFPKKRYMMCVKCLNLPVVFSTE